MHFKEYKTIISPKNGVNLYHGCSHGCIYCDSRSYCYQMNHEFTDIQVKTNAPQMFLNEIRRKRKPCMIGTGAMCDPYMQIELELEYTRKCLEYIDRYGFGVTIQTKSTNILRDLDLLKSINSKTKCVVQTTMTTFDESLCKIVEPNVSTTKERFEMLEIMRDNGIPTVVWISPLLPFINDTEENIRGLIDYCVKAKVKAIICFGIGVTLRGGNREYFYEKLDENFSNMKQKYIEAFGNSYECKSPNHHILMGILRKECNKHNIMFGVDNVFEYLHKFETCHDGMQMSFF